jgi:hypothetical protein
MNRFAENAYDSCKINNYKIVEAQIEMYNNNLMLASTLINDTSQLTLTDDQINLNVAFTNHKDKMRRYLFKIEGYLNSTLLTTTD